MDAELQQFNNERAERIRQLNDKHEKELEAFDDESTRMGFRYVFLSFQKVEANTLQNTNYNHSHCSSLALAESSKECYPDDERSLSGSMISLAHSNSSTSFPYINESQK